MSDSGLPSYSLGQHDSLQDVSESKAQPPGYGEANRGSGLQVSGETYAEKFTLNAESGHRDGNITHFTVHSTETENLVLLAPDARPVYFIDNTSALSKTIVRLGNSTSSPVVSISSIAGPFVRELLIDFESRTRSGTKIASMAATGKFHVVWQFTIKHKTYEWRQSKGVWSLTQQGAIVATYNIGKEIDVAESAIDLLDIIISTVFSIDLYARMSSDRRTRVLNSVGTRSNNAPLLGSGLLL